MSNTRLIKFIFMFCTFVVYDILFPYTINSISIKKECFRYLGSDNNIELPFEQMQDTQTGELKSIAYNRLYYPEDSFGIAKDAKVAIEIAKTIFSHKFDYHAKQFDIATSAAGIWKISGAKQGFLQPTIYIQKEDAKILRITARNDNMQKVSFVKEDIRLWKSDTTVTKLNGIIDTPLLAYQFGSIILSKDKKYRTLQKPLFISSKRDIIWQVWESRNVVSSDRVGHVWFDNRNCMILALAHY